MTPLPAWVVACTLAAAVAFAVLLDLVKAPYSNASRSLKAAPRWQKERR